MTCNSGPTGGLRVLALLESRGFKADCMFYTTLICVCSKAGKVDLLFQVCMQQPSPIAIILLTFQAILTTLSSYC